MDAKAEDIGLHIDEINERIQLACRNNNRESSSVKLIAVSKTKPNELIRAAIEHGQVDFGENKVQEMCAKMERITDPVQWHMIGALQSNKVKYMADRVDWIHSVPKLKTLKEIEKRASAVGRTINCLIQVNISDEDQKSGCAPENLSTLLKEAELLKFAKVRGLMGIATNTEDQDLIRKEFALLRSLKEAYTGSLELTELSMGMTNDLEIAIAEGSTMIRVGTAIFGARNY